MTVSKEVAEELYQYYISCSKYADKRIEESHFHGYSSDGYERHIDKKDMFEACARIVKVLAEISDERSKELRNTAAALPYW